MDDRNLLSLDLADTQAGTALSEARKFVITNENEAIKADELCSGLLGLEKHIQDNFRTAKQKAHEAHKAVCDAEARHLEPVHEARKIIKGKLGDWLDLREKERHEREERLREEARKDAEREAIEKAARLEKEGRKEEAEEVINGSVEPLDVILPKDTPKFQTLFRTKWKCQVENEQEFIAAVIQGSAPGNLLIIDHVALNRFVTATQGAVKLPGVKIWCAKI